MLLAPSAPLADRPAAAANQANAKVRSARKPAAASHSTTVALGRKPMSNATPMTSTMAMIVWITLARTWPVSTDAREIAIVRKRFTMPAVISRLTLSAVDRAPEAAAITITAGVM